MGIHIKAHLPDEILRALHAAVLKAGLERDVLLRGIHPALVASIPRASSPAGQLLVDLHTLNETPALANGVVPLQRWLENAHTLTAYRDDLPVFRAALAALGSPLPAGAEAAATSGATGGDPSGAAGAPPQAPDAGAGAGPRIRIFVSATEKDAAFVRQLEQFLSPLCRARGWAIWHRGRIPPGSVRAAALSNALAAADLIIVILTTDYLAQDETHSEAQRALSTGKRVVPVLARPAAVGYSAFAGMALLPANGVAVSRWSNPDLALSEITDAIEAVVAEIEAGKSGVRSGHDTPVDSPGPRPPSGGTPRETPSLEYVGQPYSRVFRRSGVPSATYVEPEEAHEIRVFLDDVSHGLFIQGPTQIGKSTLVKKELDGQAVMDIDAKDPGAAERIARLRRSALDGCIVVDDVHRLPPAAFEELTLLGRQLADRGGAKLVMLGIHRAGQRLQGEAAGRFDRVSIQPQSDARVRELIEQGERAANLRFVHEADIVRESLGSFRLAQEICFQLAVKDGHRRVTPTFREVASHPSTVRSLIHCQLSDELSPPLESLVRATVPPVERAARVALLWLLSRSDAATMRAATATATRQFSDLRDGFDWVENDMEAWIAEHAPVAELLRYEGGYLSAHDPRLLYFLRTTPWSDVGRQMGIDVGFSPEGELIVQVLSEPRPVFRPDGEVAVQHSAAGAERTHVVHKSLREVSADNLWAHPKARTFRDLLVAAYDSEQQALQIAAESGVRRNKLVTGSGVEALWNSILHQGARQAKIGALILRVLEDQDIAAYHPALLDCLAPIVVRQPAGGV